MKFFRRGLQKTLILVIAALSVSSGFARASDCTAFPHDPFAPNGRMPKPSKFAGECLLIDGRRSFRILTQAEAGQVVDMKQIAKPDQSQFIANIQTDGDFWVGVLPKDSVKDVIFQVEHFPPEIVAAHTQLRFQFKPGRAMKIFSQTDTTKPPRELKEIIISVEAVPFKGGPEYDLYKGTKGYFGLAKRMVALKDKARYMTFDQDHTVDQFRLAFTAKETNELFQSTIKYLHDPEMTGIYHTLDVNCTNALFESLDLYLKRSRGLVTRAITALPIFAEKALKSRGLLGKKSKMPNLKDELGPQFREQCMSTLVPKKI